MGLFAKLLRPLAPVEHPHQRPRGVLGKSLSSNKNYVVVGKSLSSNKENVLPNLKKSKGKGKKKKKKKKDDKKDKNLFWQRKKPPAAAPKLSLFLAAKTEDVNGNGVTGSTTTGSMTASNASVYGNSKNQSATGPLHEVSHQISGLTERGDSENKLHSPGSFHSRPVTPTDRPVTPVKRGRWRKAKAQSVAEGEASPKDAIQLEAQNISVLHASENVVDQMIHFPAPSERPSTPYPERKKKKSDGSASERLKAAKLRANALLKLASTEIKTEKNDSEVTDELISIVAGAVMFDDLHIDKDTANEDLRSADEGSVDTFQTTDSFGGRTKIHFTNLKQMSLFSSSSAVNSLSKNIADDGNLKESPRRSSTGELAVIHTAREEEEVQEVKPKRGSLASGAISLQDIIDDMEGDMQELHSIFRSSGTFDDLQDDSNASWANSRSDGWISNGALRDESCSSSIESIFSFNSDEFAEEDHLVTAHKYMNLSGSEMSIIVEENEESSQDPLDAALERGALNSENAGECGDYNVPELENSELSGSGLAECMGAAGAPFATRKSHSTGNRTNRLPKRGLNKSISWKAENEVFTFETSFKVNLERALEMVRSYDPRYKDAAKAKPVVKPVEKPVPSVLERSNAQKPLRSILKTSESYSGRTLVKSLSAHLDRTLGQHLSDLSFDSTSVSSHRSRQSSTSTYSSNSTSESVKYMVGRLKEETSRRRNKLINCRHGKKISSKKHCS